MTVALLPLAKCLAGTFNNIPQALAEPAWYVQFRLWIRPVPQLSTPTGTVPLKSEGLKSPGY
jgi:hypothetical protein